MPVPLFMPVQAFGNPTSSPRTRWSRPPACSGRSIDEFGFTAEFWNYDYKERIRVENAQQTAYANFSRRHG